MSSLSDILLTESRKRAVTADCVSVIEQYVAGRGGLRGIGMKAGLGLMKTLRPDLLPRIVAQLLPEIVATLEPCYSESQRTGATFEAAMLTRRDSVAQALVGIADRRMLTVQNTSAKSIYKRLRGDAEAEVVAALPLLSRTLGKYLDRSA
ncbi:MAG: hypothetical protein JWR16_520 [Nevskia sp.]|nr:hypothetical protein [Nevskia sp.]